MVNMGYSRQNIEDSVIHQKFDDIQATYLLLGRRTTDVSIRANIGVLFVLPVKPFWAFVNTISLSF